MGEFIGDKGSGRNNSKDIFSDDSDMYGKNSHSRKSGNSDARTAKTNSPQRNEGKKTQQSSSAHKSTGGSKKPLAQSGHSGAAHKSSTGSQSNAARKSSSGGQSNSAHRSSSAKTGGTGGQRSSGAKSNGSAPERRSKSGSAAVSDSSYESELRNSERALEIKKRRKINNYRRNSALRAVLLYGAIAVAVITFTLLMSTTVLFNIESINIVADEDLPYTQEEILVCSGLSAGQNMFTPTVFAVPEKIEGAMPYIEDCRLSRQLPSGVTLTVSAAQVLGVMSSQDGISYIISTTGRVLERVTVESKIASYAKIEGLCVAGNVVIGEVAQFDNDEHFSQCSEIIAGFAEHDIKLDSVSFGSGGEVSAKYDQRILFVFGVPSSLESKITLAAKLINEGKITKIESGTLDLSVEGKATFSPDYLKNKAK